MGDRTTHEERERRTCDESDSITSHFNNQTPFTARLAGHDASAMPRATAERRHSANTADSRAKARLTRLKESRRLYVDSFRAREHNFQATNDALLG